VTVQRGKVVVTGAAGSFGRVLVPHLADLGYRVVGVDRRAWPDCPPDAEFERADILKRSFDDVLRRVRPDAVVHLAMVHRFKLSRRERHRVNFEGTARVIEAARTAGVNKIILGSRATVYGALPDQAQFLTEDQPPAAGRMFADMQDLVAADLYASGMLWRHPDTEIVILRLVNVLGPRVSTLLQRYLCRPRVFTVAGFDPIYQVMHETDMAAAITCALAPGVRGVFNVTGPGEVPLHVLVEESGAVRVPLPEGLVRILRGRLGFPRIPQGAIQFLKYSCTVDGTRFREATGFEPACDLAATIGAVRLARERKGRA
jgi:UDP-glucose 4-epimerase